MRRLKVGLRRFNGRAGCRRGSAIVCVLVVILLVTLLSIQTIQTLAAIRRGDDERTKIYQARELIELGRRVDWSAVESQQLTLQIPESAVDSATDSATDVEGAAGRRAIVERQGNAGDTSESRRLVVRYPADEPGEVTTTWDEEHD